LYGTSRAISKITIHAPFDRIGISRIEVVRAQVWIGDDGISIGVVVDIIAHGQVDPLMCSKRLSSSDFQLQDDVRAAVRVVGHLMLVLV